EGIEQTIRRGCSRKDVFQGRGGFVGTNPWVLARWTNSSECGKTVITVGSVIQRGGLMACSRGGVQLGQLVGGGM
ncbi:hypothetical protein AVEN_239200-1, partial [Araneus ventricosus]